MNLESAKRVVRVLAGPALALCIVVAASTASAADKQATVNGVEYAQDVLLIQLSDNVNYFGQRTADTAACAVHNVTLDTLGKWQSLAEAALLSGKELRIHFTDCGGKKYIRVVDLWK